VSWDSVEAKVESCLKTAFLAAFDSAGLTRPHMRCYWLDDHGDSAEPAGAVDERYLLPACIITASPAVNDGWQQDIMAVPVEVAFATYPGDDPNRAELKEYYHAARGKLQDSALSVSGWTNLAFMVEPGDPPVSTTDVHVVTLSLRAEAALPLS
jgi:hypothetical protein